MSRDRWEQNLGRLLDDLTDYVGREGIDVPNPIPLGTQRLADGIFLAHAAPESKFVNICKNNRLLSQEGLVASGIMAAVPNTDEAILGTADDVFFYAASFRIPCARLRGAVRPFSRRKKFCKQCRHSI